MRDSFYLIDDVQVYDTRCPWTFSLFSHPSDQVPEEKQLFKIFEMQVAPEFARACTTGKGCYWAIDAQKIKSDQVIVNLQALLTLCLFLF
jgi:hypothetical protein